MKKLDSFFKYLNNINEILDNPSSINWKNINNDYIGEFNIGKDEYRIECFKQVGNNYSFSFSYYDGTDWTNDITNIGNQFKVMATIVDGIDFILSKNYDSIIFSVIDENETRINLYDLHCKTIEKRDGLKYYKKSSKVSTNKGIKELYMFILYKENINQNDLMESVKKIIVSGK